MSSIFGLSLLTDRKRKFPGSLSLMAALEACYRSSKARDTLAANTLTSLKMGADASPTILHTMQTTSRQQRWLLCPHGDMSQRPVPMHSCPGAALFNTVLLLKKLHAVADSV